MVMHLTFRHHDPPTNSLQTIFFGANDACVEGHQQHVPIETFKENLKKLIQHPATVAQNPRIVLITPPPINEYQLEGFDHAKDTAHPSRTAAITKTYGEAVKEVGKSLNVPVADIWTAFMTSVGWQEGQPLIGSRDAPRNENFDSLFIDGLHLTGDGYRFVFSEVMKEINATWPDQSPNSLPMVFPAWTEFYQ
ncbi:GDSL Lipase/Acylhydrolase family protein [Penicillium angulare]|uniref:GDSL Lipase/Acylhydrolase family protein n=1 Tax=Penicillium angulare TaxID=116970 RepID=UPI002541594F|nr:GDSL Lipase/Acylhydrolase family protein [Penicillium angulare]KAJ5287149.1 GDSL Lipase/Acylhydrolase family protein [Penicillium angulare]